jgi:hypothetical protein
MVRNCVYLRQEWLRQLLRAQSKDQELELHQSDMEHGKPEETCKSCKQIPYRLCLSRFSGTCVCSGLEPLA